MTSPETRLWQCPGCAKTYRIPENRADPSICPGCKTGGKKTPPPVPASNYKRAGEDWKLAPQLAGFVVVFLILSILVAAFDGSGSSSNTEPAEEAETFTPEPAADDPSESEAWVMAQRFVEDQLKSPSTADFGWQTSNDAVFKSERDPSKFSVVAWVDSQNSFGATIRMKFQCELRYLGDDEWRLEKLVFIE